MNNQLNYRNFTEFLSEKHHETKELMGPWLRSGEINMIFAARGTGKTVFCYSLAHAMATGQPFLRWNPPAASKVFFIDAESSDTLMHKRFSRVEDGSEVSALPENLKILTRTSSGFLPNLSTQEGQNIYYPLMMAADVTIVDNLLTIAPPLDTKDDDVKIWYRIKPFIYKLRNAGKTVLLIHHSAKSGVQYGTSIRENDMDNIIKLSNPTFSDNDMALPLYFEFEKGRDLAADQREPLFITYEVIGSKAQWTYQNGTEHRKKEIIRAAQTIKNKALIAAKVNCPTWLVYETLASEKAEEPIDNYFSERSFDEEPPF